MVQIGHYYHNTFLAHLTCIMLAKKIIRKIGKKNKFKNKKPIQLYSTSCDTAESAVTVSTGQLKICWIHSQHFKNYMIVS